MKVVVQPREAGPRIHLPVSIVIDKSESTGDIRDLLNRGAQSLIQSMKKELTFRGIVDLLVIHFSSESEVIMDFQPLEQISEHALDIHSSRGHTDTGKALLTALDAAKGAIARISYNVTPQLAIDAMFLEIREALCH